MSELERKLTITTDQAQSEADRGCWRQRTAEDRLNELARISHDPTIIARRVSEDRA
jgi:hypothetical protein